MARLGLEPDSIIGARVAECGFDVFERDDGLRPEGPDGLYDPRGAEAYNDYLREKGYLSENPWHDFANSGVDDNGEIASGWFMQHADRPANIAEQDSETPYLTRRGIAFMEQAGEHRWLCHLSYIKPHWPYIVPAPYHAMYGQDQVLPALRAEREKENPHPVYAAFMAGQVGQAFSRDEVRAKVVPAYMGLIKQCDDQMGVLLRWMEETGRMDDTMIVLTSDHGDYLGDHWLGEKDLFHAPSVKVPLIIYDPSPEADATRGRVCDALVESIDLAATFIQVAGGEVPDHIVEGRSLLPFLHTDLPGGGAAGGRWREFVISEYDYSATPMAVGLGLDPKQAVLYMVADHRWKLIHAEGFRCPILFDLANDPSEFDDLGEDPAHERVRAMMYERLFRWSRRHAQRTTRSDADINAMRGGSRRKGVLLGFYDGSEVPAALTERYRGKPG
jgi:arylsulfatase A-like enzyme